MAKTKPTEMDRIEKAADNAFAEIVSLDEKKYCPACEGPKIIARAYYGMLSDTVKNSSSVSKLKIKNKMKTLKVTRRKKKHEHKRTASFQK
jgi:hypothetical protein